MITLGNVRQTIKTTNGVVPSSTSGDWAYSKAEYYPFGMKFLNVNSYRYGYQGEYAEDETEEDGIKANSFQLRLYNPRLGRWMSPDPYGQYHSPYLAMGNNPILRVDPDGGFDDPTKEWSKTNTDGYNQEEIVLSVNQHVDNNQQIAEFALNAASIANLSILAELEKHTKEAAYLGEMTPST